MTALNILMVGLIGALALAVLYALYRSPPVHTGNSDESDPGYDYPLLDDLLNFWDSLKWWQKPLAVWAFIVVGGMVVGAVVGYWK